MRAHTHTTPRAETPRAKPETQKTARERERAEARERLRGWIKPGDTVYTILDSVSRSGMRRQIRVVLLKGGQRGPVDLHPNHAIGVLLGIPHGKRHGRALDSLTINGCGMDMGFHLVNSLSYALYGGEGKGCGYKCLGKGKDGRGRCPSNYHNNHRDRIRCEGVWTPDPANPDGGERRRCWTPGGGFFSTRVEIPEDWPRGAPIDLGEGASLPGPLLACLTDSGEAGRPYEVCPTCKGEGYLANPEGPERWDLRHTDGYALRHRWL